jgi:hypothetical protein
VKLIVALTGLSLAITALGCGVREHHAEAQAKKESKEAVVVVPAAPAQAQGKSSGDEGIDFPEREEIRQSYPLSAGAQVVVSGINGLVKVETADTDTAEVYIVRSVRNREDFQSRKVTIEHSPTLLTIRVKNDRQGGLLSSLFGPRRDERQRVMLKLPRRVEFETSGVNGNVVVGELHGPVALSGVNGNISVARATGKAEVTGVNGNVDLTLAQLAGDGVEVHGVNGNIELRFADEVNADLEVHGVNGRIDPELPNLAVQGEAKRHLKARLGSGGAQIAVSGINGNVHLAMASGAAPAAAGR